MNKILALALVGMVGSSAHAIELKLVAGDDPDADEHITLALSETGMVSIYMTMFEGDGNVSFFIAFLDATPLGSGDSVGYDVLGTVFKMERNDGSGWHRRVDGVGGRNMEDYVLIAADDEGGRGPGTNAPWKGVVDSIIIHGTEIGEYDLYYENGETADRDRPRPPGLFALDYTQHPYSLNFQLPGFIWFKNAWIETQEGFEFDVPFVVRVTPEPASLALLAVGGLALLRRRN